MSDNRPLILIDDDKDEADILMEVLEKLGIENEVIWFSDGESAFSFLKTTEKKPLLIFSDINMPGISGIDLRRRLIEDEETKRKSIPFIFLTTAMGSLAIKKAYEMCVQGFFQKPPIFEDYVSTVSQIYHYWKNCRHPAE